MSFGADPILRLAIASVIALSSFTAAFMVYAFVLLVRGKRLERRRNVLEARWSDSSTPRPAKIGRPPIPIHRAPTMRRSARKTACSCWS